MANGTYDDFLAALRMRETSDNYQAQNQYGARGAYQFHEAALKQIGWYTDNTAQSNPGDDWIGTFSAKSGVTSIQQFLNSPTSQDNAMKAWANEIWKVASSDQFRSTDHLGETINGTVVTATGIIGGSHLWGTDNLDRYLDSGGSYDPKDPFGTPISEYLRLFSGYESPFDAPSTPSTPAPTPAPTPTPPTTGVTTRVGTGSDTLVLKITQDAYQGDSQYAVFVDGKQIGGTVTAKALHNSGQADTLEIKGDWGVGNHNVSVQLLNDLYGSSWDQDRNVWVESATYNGAAVANSKLSVASSTPQGFTVNDTTAAPAPAPTPTPPTTGVTTQVGTGSDTLVLKITQDAYQGDSQYAVFVDGKQIGGTLPQRRSTTAARPIPWRSRATGAWATTTSRCSCSMISTAARGTRTATSGWKAPPTMVRRWPTASSASPRRRHRALPSMTPRQLLRPLRRSRAQVRETGWMERLRLMS